MSKKALEKVVLYQGKNGEIELRADSENDTIWATKPHIADLFDTTPQNITIHLGNIFNEQELDEKATSKESLLVQTEGGRSVQRLVTVYNLDAIIAVGYRVNSKKATQFRIWATRILKAYVMNGYALNERKLSGNADKLETMRDTLEYLGSPGLQGKLKGKLTLKVTKDLI